ncbi:family 20 glycosylhydrolase [Marinilabiliaceae bacterium ANBcel2]|nr:family 20 glycosylhydrolase [Marinilabiliaceae bacterium ANBcel2]
MKRLFLTVSILICFSTLTVATNLEKIAKEFSPDKNLDLTGSIIEYKNLNENISVSIIGSSYKQIIDYDGTITRPISNKSTEITFELSDGEESVQTESFSVKVEALEEIAKGEEINKKPSVLPALQEWQGGTNSWNIPNKKIEIVVKNSSLKERMAIFAKDLEKLSHKNVTVVKASNNQKKGDIIVNLSADSSLGKEGYTIDINEEQIIISAVEPIGAFWATRTILQVLKNNDYQFPGGKIRDYPQYEIRGFMYDVGRKPTSMQAIYQVMETMSYYKLNDLQLHLNDNFIWLDDYTDIPNNQDATEEQKAAARKEVMEAAPTAFRLESDIIGKNGIPLTCEKHYFTKEEFGQLIDDSRLYGVNIVPEIDVPGHAMSFVRVRPDLMYRGELSKPHDVERLAMLDVSSDIYDEATGITYREETMNFVKTVFDEYLIGDEDNPPVFRDAVIHIGTDEYYGDSEDYRWFANEMLKHIKKRGFTPRLWGSLTAKPGETNITSENVQMHVWSLGWQRPIPAIEKGFDIINILDVDTYIVPNGTGNVGGYGDYVNLEHLYGENWQPHILRQYKVPAGHPQMLGAQWALWNDNSFMRSTGLTDYDLYNRIRRTSSVIAEKTWNNGTDNSFEEFKKLFENVGLPPKLNPKHKVNFKELALDLSEISPKAIKAKISNDIISLNGEKSYVKPDSYDNIGTDYTAEFMIKRTSNSTEEEILFSSYRGELKAVQNETGKFGISRDGWDFSFDYTLPINEWVKIKLISEGRHVTLYVNDQKIGEPIRHKYPENQKFSTFVFPLEYIGAKENSFNGKIKNIRFER